CAARMCEGAACARRDGLGGADGDRAARDGERGHPGPRRARARCEPRVEAQSRAVVGEEAPDARMTLTMLARPLRPRERRSTARDFAEALRSGTTFAPPATAFVSLYERGRTIGCVGHADFASALAAARVDPRFGGAREDLGRATTQLSLLVRGRVVDAS